VTTRPLPSPEKPWRFDTLNLPLEDGPWLADKWTLSRPQRFEADGSSTCVVKSCQLLAGRTPGDKQRTTDVLCVGHRRRYAKLSSKPILETFIDDQSDRVILAKRGADTWEEVFPEIDFRRVDPRVAHEMRYVIGRKVRERRWGSSAYVSSAVGAILLYAERKGLASLLEVPVETMMVDLAVVLRKSPIKGLTNVKLAQDALPSIVSILRAASVDPWDSDRWNRHELRLEAKVSSSVRTTIVWTGVTCDWLRVGVKTYARKQLQTRARSFSTIESYAKGARLLSRFFDEEAGPLGPGDLTRGVFLDFLSWVVSESPTKRSNLNAVNSLASVLFALKCDGIVPDLPETVFLLRGEWPDPDS
jgi:hypothetical protein